MLLTLSFATAAVIEAPFTQLASGQVVVVLDIGTTEAPFIVDTGASVTVITPKLWAAAGNTPDEGARIGGAGAGGELSGARLVTSPELLLGGAALSVGYAVVMDLETGEEMPNVGGILGLDVLRAYVAEFDFSTHVVRLYGKEDLPPSPTAWTTTKHLRGGLLGVDLLFGTTPVPAVVDLGASGTILNTAAAALPGVTAREGCAAHAFGADENALTLSCAAVDKLSVASRDFGAGDVTVNDLPVFTTLRMGKKHGKPAPAAVLGVDRLGQGTFVVDAAGRRVGWIDP